MKLFSFCIPLLATVSFGFLSTWAQDLPPTGASSVTQVAERVPGLDPALAKNLADGAVGLAAKRLSSNPVGESGKRLLQFASALDPTNENLLYLKALIGLGRPIDPAVIPVKVTDEEYVAYLLHLGKTQNPSYFRLLLYHMVYSLNPVNRIANVKLQLARERGVVADFDGTIKRLSNTFPPPRPLPRPILPPATAKDLADGTARLAGGKFQTEGVTSNTGLYLMQLAGAIDPANESVLYIKALLLGNLPLTEINLELNQEAYFANLKNIIQHSENETVTLLLHHLSLVKDPTDRSATVALQKAKVEGKDTEFQALVDSLKQQTYAASSMTSPGGAGASKPPPTLDQRLKNSQLKDTLVSRKWVLTSLKTREDWFFDFHHTGSRTEAGGTCHGRRGQRIHSWKSWTIDNSILIIDDYMKFKYDARLRQWVLADGRKGMFLR